VFPHERKPAAGMTEREPTSSGDAAVPPGRARGGGRSPRGVAGRERALYLAVGAANTGIAVAIFTALQLAVGRYVHYLVVLMVTHVASVLIAFVLYRRLVFQVHGGVWRDLARFELVYLSALGVNFVLLPLLVEIAGIPVLPAQLLVVGVTAAMSFVGHKHLSFRRPAVVQPGRMSP
jgi:putative flippase GtrA